MSESYNGANIKDFITWLENDTIDMYLVYNSLVTKYLDLYH